MVRNRRTYSVSFGEVSSFFRQLLLLLAVVCNVAHLFLEHTNCLEIGSVIKSITTKKEKLEKDNRQYNK